MFGLMLFPLMALLSLFTTDGDGGGDGGDGDGSQGDQNANAGGNGGKDDQGDKGGGDAFTAITSQAAFDAAIKARLSQQERSLTKTITESVKAALKTEQDAAQAKEQGDFKTLYEAVATENETLKGEVTKRDRAALISKVAAAHKLPDDLAEVLQGDDEAALTEHAKRLAKHIKPAGAADTEAGAGNRNGANRSSAATKQDGKTPAYSFLPAGAVPIPD